jgi:hypothetical protein
MTALPSERFGTSIMQRDINTLIRYLEGLSGGGVGGYPDRIENATGESVIVGSNGTTTVKLGADAADKFAVTDDEGNVRFSIANVGQLLIQSGSRVILSAAANGLTYMVIPKASSFLIQDVDSVPLLAVWGSDSDGQSVIMLETATCDAASLRPQANDSKSSGTASYRWSDVFAVDHDYSGNLKPYRNSTNYTGYVFVPLTTPLTSTSFDGDDRIDTQNGVVDLSSVFSAPAGIKAIACTLSVKCGTINKQVALGPSETYYYAIHQHTQVANQLVEISGTVPCDANGDVYFYTDAVEGGAMTVYWRIWGYYI